MKNIYIHRKLIEDSRLQMGKKKELKPKLLFLKDKKRKKGFGLLLGGESDVYEKFYEKLVKIPWEQPVDIIVKTHGGSALWCAKICYVLKNRTGRSRVFVESFAHSAGTIIAITATELFITPDTTFSAIDAQGFPFSDLFQASMHKLSKFVEDPRAALSELSKDRAIYFRNTIEKYMNTSLHHKENVMKMMHDDPAIHETLFFKDDLDKIGIKYKIWDGDVIPDPKKTSKIVFDEVVTDFKVEIKENEPVVV